MELKQLEALAAVAEHGRFSAAARALDTVQSNISTHIARLEDDLGAILIDRSAGQLTPEGQVVLTRARRINTELAALRDDVNSMTSRVTGQVRLGIIGTTGRWLLPPLLDELSRAFPDVMTTVIDSTTTALVPLLEHGDLDLTVINTPLQHDEIFTSPLFDEQLVVIAPEGHPSVPTAIAPSTSGNLKSTNFCSAHPAPIYGYSSTTKPVKKKSNFEPWPS